MVKTKEYKYLEKRIKKLKKHFDFKQSISGTTPLQEDRLKGFCLLCHAEFEDYFESIANRIYNDSLEDWMNKKTANYQLASIFVSQDRIESGADVFTKSRQLLHGYENIIKNNHGIKDKDIKKMYTPLGYLIDDFDSVLISELNELGRRRGESAHSSAQHTTIMLDKVTEFDRVNRILELLLGFENTLREKYKRL